MIKLKKNYKIVFVLFVIALAIRILFVFVPPVKIWDETVYMNLGYDLSRNPFNYSFTNKWSDFVPGDWPEAGFRAPLLPYTLSILYFLKFDSFVDFLVPLTGALCVIFIFLLAKDMFNEKIAFYSAAFLSVLPLHAYYSGKVLTDAFSIFFAILTVIFFWRGFEMKKMKFKLLFGIFLALSILARYTNLWLIPLFLVYLILKNRNLSFLKDKTLWLVTGIFFVTLSPLLIYGIMTYNNPLGAFIHALKASSYRGIVHPWYFPIFFIISIIFGVFLVYIASNQKMRKDHRIIFLLLWFLTFFAFSSIMPYKEDRFLMPIVPPLVIISALFLKNIRHKKLIFNLTVLLLTLSNSLLFIYLYRTLYIEKNECFLEANMFLKSVKDDSIVITDASPIVYYYSKKETHFYPRPFSLDNIKNLFNECCRDKPTYILFSEYDMPLENFENRKIKAILNSNFEIVYKCPENGNSSIIYKYQ
jgi:4-amino-4-deoxy-L-arabinose transferase-like glycosyltransferase